jgi:hypothetical protein
MKKVFKISLISWLLGALFMVPALALAQDGNTPDDSATPATTQNHMLDRLMKVGGQAGFETDPAKASTPIIIGTVVRAFLGFLGLTFIILILISGFKWMTASGNEEEVKKATKMISNAVIGLVVALSAWSLWAFFLEKIILMGK